MCELLEVKIIAYIFSLAFQVSGAVLLIVQYWGRTEARIIAEYFPGNNFVSLDKTQIITMKKDKVRNCVRRVYHNRMSFIYIAFGYVLSIWGDTLSACKVCILSFVILWTLLLIGLERLIAWTFSVIIYRKDITKEYSELKDVVYPNVIEF